MNTEMILGLVFFLVVVLFVSAYFFIPEMMGISKQDSGADAIHDQKKDRVD